VAKMESRGFATVGGNEYDNNAITCRGSVRSVVSGEVDEWIHKTLGCQSASGKTGKEGRGAQIVSRAD
jgi:hypothetical protein